MQAGNEPDIENIEGVITRLCNCNGPSRRPQGEEFPMHNREFPAIRQMNLKWRERLGIVIFSQRFDCHAISYSIDNRSLQSVT